MAEIKPLTGTLQDFIDRHITGLTVECQACRKKGLSPVKYWVETLTAEASIHAVEARLKCPVDTCRSADVLVERLSPEDPAKAWNTSHAD